MISKDDVLQVFEKFKIDSKYFKEFNLKVLEYFIQELSVIIEKFDDKETSENLEELRCFFLEFEEGASEEEQEPENFLDGPVITLFLSIGDDTDKVELKTLLHNAKIILKKYS
ncbi:MAG: hypothetical protein AABX19_00790 [Nanoarchaeota archaeon]